MNAMIFPRVPERGSRWVLWVLELVKGERRELPMEVEVLGAELVNVKGGIGRVQVLVGTEVVEREMWVQPEMVILA